MHVKTLSEAWNAAKEELATVSPEEIMHRFFTLHADRMIAVHNNDPGLSGPLSAGFISDVNGTLVGSVMNPAYKPPHAERLDAFLCDLQDLVGGGHIFSGSAYDGLMQELARDRRVSFAQKLADNDQTVISKTDVGLKRIGLVFDDAGGDSYKLFEKMGIIVTAIDPASDFMTEILDAWEAIDMEQKTNAVQPWLQARAQCLSTDHTLEAPSGQPM